MKTLARWTVKGLLGLLLMLGALAAAVTVAAACFLWLVTLVFEAPALLWRRLGWARS